MSECTLDDLFAFARESSDVVGAYLFEWEPDVAWLRGESDHRPG